MVTTLRRPPSRGSGRGGYLALTWFVWAATAAGCGPGSVTCGHVANLAERCGRIDPEECRASAPTSTACEAVWDDLVVCYQELTCAEGDLRCPREFAINHSLHCQGSGTGEGETG